MEGSVIVGEALFILPLSVIGSPNIRDNVTTLRRECMHLRRVHEASPPQLGAARNDPSDSAGIGTN